MKPRGTQSQTQKEERAHEDNRPGAALLVA
jgi:hypothetical protein